MAVQSYTLALVQGQTLSMSATLKQGGVAFDLTSYTIAGKIRRKFSDSASLVDLTVTITDAAAGEISISLTAAQTAALTPNPSSPSPDTRDQTIGVYDIEITLAGVITRIMQGTVTLSLEATK